jgi:hypothetical protein
MPIVQGWLNGLCGHAGLLMYLAHDRLPGSDALGGLGTSLRAGTAQVRAEQGRH